MGKLHPLIEKMNEHWCFNSSLGYVEADRMLREWLEEKSKEFHESPVCDLSTAKRILGLLSNSSEDPERNTKCLSGDAICNCFSCIEFRGHKTKPKPSSEPVSSADIVGAHSLKESKLKPSSEKECWCMTSDKWNQEWAFCPTCGAGKTQPRKELWEKLVDGTKTFLHENTAKNLAAIAEKHFSKEA